MKRLIHTAWLAFMPWLCFAQLSGTVVDVNTKEKVQGAVVTVENSFLVSVTDAQGKFSFSKTNTGSVKLLVTHLGYENVSQEMQIPNSNIEILFQRKTYIAEEVTVTATRASDNSPTAFTNVNKKELEENNLGKDIPFLLSSTLSVVVTSDAGNGVGYTGIRIRGSDATRVNVTINGIPVNDAEEQGVYWVDIPDLTSSVDNVQVQRGIGTSTNGAGAFGGSVNVQTSVLSTEPFATVNSSYGSFNTWKNTVNFGTGLLKNKFAFEGRLSKITSDGYIDRATSDLKSFFISGGYYGSKSTLRAIVFSGREKTYQSWNGDPAEKLQGNKDTLLNYYNNNIGYLFFTPQDSTNLFSSSNRTYNYFTYKNQTDNYQQNYYQLLYSFAASSSLNLNAALHYTKGFGYYEEYKPQQSFVNYKLDNVVVGIDTITSTDLIRQLWLDNDFYGYTFSANYDRDQLQFTFGGGGNHYKGRHYDQVIWAQYFSNGVYPYVYNDNDAQKDDVNFFVKATYSVNAKVHLFGDAQYRTVNYSFFGFNEDFTNSKQSVALNFFNPKGGVTVDINEKNKIYASAGVGHKEPVRGDYVSSTPLSRPKPEELLDGEFGYKYWGNKIRFGVNFYSMNYKDQLILTGKINDVGAYTRENVDKSHRHGIEVEFAWNIVKNLLLSSNVTLSENKIETFNEYIDDFDYDSLGNAMPQQLVVHKNTDISFSPSVTSSTIVSYTLLKKITLQSITRYVGKQYLDNTSDENRKLNSYIVNDFFISCHTSCSSIKDIALKFGVYNLFDSKYESNGWTYPYIYGGSLLNSNAYYPQAGLNWMCGVTLKF